MMFRGLQIAVNNASRVCFRERVRDLDGIFQCFFKPQALPPNHLIQRLARHVLHRDELDSVGLSDVVDVNNIGMVKS